MRIEAAAELFFTYLEHERGCSAATSTAYGSDVVALLRYLEQEEIEPCPVGGLNAGHSAAGDPNPPLVQLPAEHHPDGLLDGGMVLQRQRQLLGIHCGCHHDDALTGARGEEHCRGQDGESFG